MKYNIRIESIKKIVQRIEGNQVDINKLYTEIYSKWKIKYSQLSDIKPPFSIYVLSHIGISHILLDDIRNYYEDFDSFFMDLKRNVLKVRLSQSIKDEIQSKFLLKDNFLEIFTNHKVDPGSSEDKDTNIFTNNKVEYSEFDEKIISIFQKNLGILTLRNISNILFTGFVKFKPDELRNTIKKLVDNNIIHKSLNGYKIVKLTIEQFISYSNIDYIKEFPKYLEDRKSFYCKNLSITEYEKKMRYEINQFPIFVNETLLYEILRTYDIKYAILVGSKFTKLLYNYLKFKYSFKPISDESAYIADFEIYKTVEGKSQLIRNKKFIYEGQMYSINFDNLIFAFLKSKNSKSTEITDFRDFINFKNKLLLSTYGLYHNPKHIPQTNNEYIKKLKKSDKFIKIKDEFYYLNTEQYSEDIVEKIENLLNQVDSHISFKKLYDKFCEDLNEDEIGFKDFQLWIYKISNLKVELKLDKDVVYSTTYKPNVWLADFLMFSDVNSIEELYQLINKTSGLSIEQIHKYYGSELDKYDDNNFTVNELDENVMLMYKEFLTSGFASFIGINKLILKNKLPYTLNDFINSRILMNLDYKKDASMIYKIEFNTTEEAIKKYISQFAGKTLKKAALLKQLGDSKYNYYYDKLVRSYALVEVSENHLYVYSDEEINVIKSFISELIEQMDTEHIYTLDEIINFRIVREGYKLDLIRKLVGIGNTFLIDLLKFNPALHSKYTGRMLFKKHGGINKKVILDYIMSSISSHIYLSELFDKFETDFGYTSTGDIIPILRESNYYYNATISVIFKNREKYYQYMGGKVNEGI